MPENSNEVMRIQKEYERRNALSNIEYNPLYSASTHLNKFRLGVGVSKFLVKCFPEGLSKVKFLDVGCGTGGFLHDLQIMGASNENLFGIDLSDERIDRARSYNSSINFELGTGGLPYENGKFDLVSAITVFTSILGDDLRKSLAHEMIAVLKDFGYVLIYDFNYNNPKNDQVRALTVNQVKELFPGCKISRVRMTLAPPISRPISRFSITLAYLMEVFLPFLRTHTLYLIQKQ